MINDIKLGLKVVRYGLNVKACVVISIIFLLIGILCDFFVPSAPINGLYIGMGAMLFVQMICSVSVSTMVQTSSLKKRLQTSVPAFAGGAFLLLGNTISILAKLAGLNMLKDWSTEGEVASGVIITTILMVIMVLYMTGAMKLFWLATVGFFVVYLLFFSFSNKVSFMMTSESPFAIIPLELAIVLSYVMIIVSAALMYLIFTATYKREYSKQNFETQLKRAK